MRLPISQRRGNLGALGLAVLLLAARAGAGEKWAVHEWGTFTSLQDETGEAIGGINTDDEPVPPFVHELAGFLLLRPTEVPNIFFQGAPSCHPDVTMRLETPVIYFHPPKSETGIQHADVRVKFRGGWLTEFYPDAWPNAPGFRDYVSGRIGPQRLFQFGPLRSSTESQLTWSELHLGGHWPVTNTTAHVWTSPRAVQAASVQTTNGESEKFLFYRGVAHLNAPLRISRDTNSGELLFHSQLAGQTGEQPLAIRALWLVDIQPGGKIAFRRLPPVMLGYNSKKILAHTPATFAADEFDSNNLEKLKVSLQRALVADGLFADEAQALLNTWELSYFQSAGLRVFFLVPRAWTDFYLPLDISLPAELQRVMVGRIELVTPAQREKLGEISRCPALLIQREAGQLWTNFYGRITFNFSTNNPGAKAWQQMNREMAQVTAGQIPLAGFMAVTPTYQAYLALGRFRNALVLADAQHHPALTNFIATYRLEGCQTAEIPPAPVK